MNCLVLKKLYNDVPEGMVNNEESKTAPFVKVIAGNDVSSAASVSKVFPALRGYFLLCHLTNQLTVSGLGKPYCFASVP